MTRASRADYEAFLRVLMVRRNHLRRERLRVEHQVLRALPPRRLEASTSEVHRVARHSTVLVRGNFYSVPSQLIGEWIEVRVFADCISNAARWVTIFFSAWTYRRIIYCKPAECHAEQG